MITNLTKCLFAQHPFCFVIEMSGFFVSNNIKHSCQVTSCNPDISFNAPFPNFFCQFVAFWGFCTPHIVNVSNSGGVIDVEFNMDVRFVCTIGPQAQECCPQFKVIYLIIVCINSFILIPSPPLPLLSCHP